MSTILVLLEELSNRSSNRAILKGLKCLLYIPRYSRRLVKYSFPRLYYASSLSKIPIDVIRILSLISLEETAINLVLGRRQKS